MRSLPDENRTAQLRTRYVELIRLREYVHRLEILREEKSVFRQEKPASDGTLEGAEDCEKLVLNDTAQHGSDREVAESC